jgi:hypothetical protein
MIPLDTGSFEKKKKKKKTGAFFFNLSSNVSKFSHYNKLELVIFKMTELYISMPWLCKIFLCSEQITVIQILIISHYNWHNLQNLLCDFRSHTYSKFDENTILFPSEDLKWFNIWLKLNYIVNLFCLRVILQNTSCLVCMNINSYTKHVTL